MFTKFYNLKMALIAVLFFVFYGWFSVSKGVSEVVSYSDQWQALYVPSKPSLDYDLLSNRINDSNLLPRVNSEVDYEASEQEEGVVVGESENSVPLFPRIVSAAVLDNTPVVALAMGEEGVQMFRSGDALSSGWILSSVSMTQVTAIYKGDEHIIKVNDYGVEE